MSVETSKQKQYINASNEAPGLRLGTVLFWYLVIDYFKLPQWTFGVWGILALVLIANFFVRIFTEEGVDVVERD